jgi:hypothetical protein
VKGTQSVCGAFAREERRIQAHENMECGSLLPPSWGRTMSLERRLQAFLARKLAHFKESAVLGIYN